MNKEEFIEELIDILEIEEENVTFKTSLHLDSLEILSLIVFLDEKFGIKANAKELENISYVSDIVKLVGAENIQ